MERQRIQFGGRRDSDFPPWEINATPAQSAPLKGHTCYVVVVGERCSKKPQLRHFKSDSSEIWRDYLVSTAIATGA